MRHVFLDDTKQQGYLVAAPVVRPQPRGFRAAQPGNREPRPPRPDPNPPRRAALHDRQMPLGTYHLDAGRPTARVGARSPVLRGRVGRRVARNTIWPISWSAAS